MENKGEIKMTIYRSKGKGINRKIYPIDERKLKGIVRETKGSNINYPSMQETLHYLLTNVKSYGVQRQEGSINDDLTWHKFSTLNDANAFIQKIAGTAPHEGEGYHKVRVDLIYKDHTQRTMRIDVSQYHAPTIEENVYRADKYYAENPDFANRIGFIPYVKEE